MTATEQTSSLRMPTLREFSLFIRYVRELRKWSQEQLADISGLTPRTIQRVEKGEPSSKDTRRALARAFEVEDIDAFNKPIYFPEVEALRAQQEQFAKDNVTLKAMPLTSGKQLAKLAETTRMDLFSPAIELSRGAEEEFAALTDYFRDYRDCHDMYAEVGKFEVYDAMEVHIAALKSMDVGLCYAIRKIVFKSAPGREPIRAEALYVVACQLGEELTEFATPKAFNIG